MVVKTRKPARSNPNKGKKLDTVSGQWLPVKIYNELVSYRANKNKYDKINSKPYAKWTKADKAWIDAYKGSGNRRKPQAKKEQEAFAKIESGGLTNAGFTNINSNTLQNLLFLREKYPEIKNLPVQDQKNIEYGVHMMRDHKGTKKYETIVKLLIKKAFNKASNVEPGHWLSGDEVKYCNDAYEEWGFPYKSYSAIYGSDPV